MLWAAISMTRTLKAQFSLRSADAVLGVPYLTLRKSDLLPSPASVCLACKPQGLSGGGGGLLGSLQNSPEFQPYFFVCYLGMSYATHCPLCVCAPPSSMCPVPTFSVRVPVSLIALRGGYPIISLLPTPAHQYHLCSACQ